MHRPLIGRRATRAFLTRIVRDTRREIFIFNPAKDLKASREDKLSYALLGA